ncbi:ty3-gypsy retrotransposon protein [Tanacetum coccineum]
MLGYDYEISYKKGSENTAANALSKISSGSELCSLILSTIEDNTNTGTKYTWTNRELRRKGKFVVGSDEQLRKTLSDLAASPGLLQPLPIPTKVWDNISTDFIEALPLSQGKTVLFVVVDRLSKYAYFIPMSHPFTANQVAQVFMDDIYKLHGMPNTIMSDRDKIFISQFWQSLFKVMKVQLNLSTAYHPQTDSQTKLVNNL